MSVCIRLCVSGYMFTYTHTEFTCVWVYIHVYSYSVNMYVCTIAGFFPAKRAFCSFCHNMRDARALSPKINILQANQAKINIFCVQFQELSNAAFTCQLSCGALVFFPAK